MKVFVTLLTVLIPLISAAEVRIADVPPEEADQYINGQDQTLRYAPKVDTNVPAVRYLGKEPHHVLEDIYLANQYHGQNGLGDYVYGYSVPDIAKTERKKSNDVRGSYQYVNGDGKEIKVEYWDDGTGFHQTDNVPQVVPQQVPDSPEVQAAKEEHFRRWRAEAERNSRAPADPNADQYADRSGQYSENDERYESTEDPNRWAYKPSDDEKGPPRGFFYNFDYPVGIIVSRGAAQRKRETLGGIYDQNRQIFNRQLRRGAGTPASYQVHY